MYRSELLLLRTPDDKYSMSLAAVCLSDVTIEGYTAYGELHLNPHRAVKQVSDMF